MNSIGIKAGRHALTAAIAIGWGLTAAPSALASSIIPVTFDKLVERAGSIVKVRVVNSESFVTVGDDAATPNFVELGAIAIAPTPGPDLGIGRIKAAEPGSPQSAQLGRHGGAVMTRVSLQVLDVLKGSPAATLSLIVAGGTIDGITTEIGGLPRLGLDGTYLLFVSPDYATSGVPTVGAFQGVFRYASDPKTGSEVLLNGEGLVVTGIRKGRVLAESAGAIAIDGSRVRAAPQPVIEVGLEPPVTASTREAPPAPMAPAAFADAVRAALDVRR